MPDVVEFFSVVVVYHLRRDDSFFFSKCFYRFAEEFLVNDGVVVQCENVVGSIP